MALQTDSVISIKKQTDYTTAVTPDQSTMFAEEALEWMPTYTQGVGTTAGALTDAADTRVLTKEEVGGTIGFEARTKGLLRYLEAAFGSVTSTQISGAAYQHVFTPIANDYLPSYTIQKSIPLVGGGDHQPHTFDGMVCSRFEIAAENGGIPLINTSWVGRNLETGTAHATPSYPASTRLFSFIHGTIRSGSITPPTTTALASGGTAVANIRRFSLSLDNNLDTEGFNFGASGKRSRPPAVGLRKITGNLFAEYTSNTFRDAWRADSDLALVLQFKTAVAIVGSNYPTFEVLIPLLRLEGELPKATRSGAGTQSIDFTGLDGRSASAPIFATVVSSETTP